LVFVLASSTAQAQRLRFDWEAPPTCPSQDALSSEIQRLLGGTIPGGGAPITAHARAVANERGFELTLETAVEGARGERTLSAERCEELAAAAALIVALMIDPDAVARVDPTEPSALVAPQRIGLALGSPALPAARPLPPPEPEPPQEEAREPIRPLLGAGALIDIGTLPALTGGVLLEAGFGIAPVDGRIRATLLFPETATAQELPGATADLWSLAVGVLGCLRPIDVFRALGFCADLEAGSVFGRGGGITDPRFGAGFWLAAGGAVTLAWQPEEWFDLEGMAEVLGQIAASDFAVTVNGPGEATDVVLFRPSGVSGRFGLVAHVHF
jgi:hypothetical protein